MLTLQAKTKRIINKNKSINICMTAYDVHQRFIMASLTHDGLTCMNAWVMAAVYQQHASSIHHAMMSCKFDDIMYTIPHCSGSEVQFLLNLASYYNRLASIPQHFFSFCFPFTTTMIDPKKQSVERLASFMGAS